MNAEEGISATFKHRGSPLLYHENMVLNSILNRVETPNVFFRIVLHDLLHDFLHNLLYDFLYDFLDDFLCHYLDNILHQGPVEVTI